MVKKFKKLWQTLSPHDRKMIRWTAIVCYVISMATLAYLYNMAKHVPQEPETAHADSTAHTPPAHEEEAALHQEESEEPLPPPPAGAQELLAGLDSFDTRAHRELSKIYAERQDFANSLEHARRIAPWMEEDLEFQGQIGRTLLLHGNPGEAIPHLEKAIRLGGKSPDLVADHALAVFRSKGAEAGLTTIREGMKEFPDHPLLSTHEAAMFGESIDRADAGNTLFQKLVRKFPYFSEARYQYGRFLMNQGNFASALSELQSAIRLDPMDSRMHGRIGMAYFHLNRDSDAERSYKTALAMNHRDYNTWFNLGELYMSIANETDWAPVFAENTRKALEAYLAALANNAGHPDAHYRIGVILNANRQNREALRHLEAALLTDPHSVRILIQIATAWEALGEKQKAWDYIQQAYEIDPFNQLVASQYKRLRVL